MIMKTKKLLIFGFIIILVGSCKNYLEPWPNGNYDSETIWNYQNLVQGLVNRCYDYVDAYNVTSSRRNYNDNEGAYLEGATDNAVLTSSTNVMRRYAVNAMTTSQDPFQTYWDRDYRALSQVNLFLKDRRGINTRYMVNAHFNDLVKNRLQGEAFALRAWFEWDLLQKFGGKSADGQMLGFPIVTDFVDVNSDINYTRNTYDECVAQILRDCDSAYKYLPIAHRDFLVSVAADRVYAGGRYWGRFDGITMKALKATVYLTWASPRFNPSNVVARWDSAAFNAKKVVDFKINVDQIASGNSFRPTGSVSWTNPNSPEIVFATYFNTSNTDIERMFYPGGFQGNGEIGASQELVNTFGMANGYPIDDPTNRGGYDAADPYSGRDPRFYSAIFYNGANADRNNDPAKPMYTFENWANGGKDAAGISSKNSNTNYYIKKFVYMGTNWSDATVVTAPHSKFLVRWAHMVLTFAEAANHVTHDPNTALYGLTPKDAIKYMRARKTYDGATPSFNVNDPYLDEVAGLGETAFDDLVKRERRIETCFEGMRFYDLRRWTTDANWESVINAPVHGVAVTQNPDLSFTYDMSVEVEKRSFTSPYNPIPYNEMLRMSNLVQNEGWPSWN